MNNDKPLIAALLGALSTMPGEIFTRLLVSFGIGQYSIYQLDSLFVTFDRPTVIIGVIVNIIFGGFIGTVFYYLLQKLGQDYLILKGLTIGLLSWVLTELLFTSTIEGKYIPIRSLSDYYIHISGAVVFGVTLGLLFKKYLVTNPVRLDNR
ncbi:MAG TPA: hypothetical protein DER60_12865 [Syntrophomonas sp.]|jgi:ABC-type uncharacterized transport system permease subunit|nr:hypothetical protein [Syntrophomonas sp.]